MPVLPLENSVVHKIFSRGCAPHPLSLETRFSLYHIKVLHLLANRLPGRGGLARGARGEVGLRGSERTEHGEERSNEFTP